MRNIIIILFILLSTTPLIVFGQDAPKEGYFNPDVSVIVDGFYQNASNKEGAASLLESINGFNTANLINEEEAGIREGLNLREAEVYFSNNIDPYFYGYLTIAVKEDEAHIEEAVIQTTALPHGLELKVGRLLSNIGRLNSQHSHYWDFTDQPLVHLLMFGDHGINDTGVQLSYLAPTSYYLMGGVEAFEGNNEKMFSYSGKSPLPDRSGPRVLVGWLKIAPNMASEKDALQFGASFGQGLHQEILDTNDDDISDRWLSGNNRFWGVDGVYKYDSKKAYGQGDWVVQAEYFAKQGDLLVKKDDLTGLVSRHSKDEKDGYYLQATYGFMPNWQLGARWEQVGLTNKAKLPDGDTVSFDPSQRAALALTYRLSEFSYLRLQFENGKYETTAGSENVSQVFLQIQISMGKHGAHKF